MSTAIKTTSLRIRPDLHAKVRKLAEAEGTSPHNFMLAAIEEKARSTELQQTLHADADLRMRRMAASGRGLDWSEMKRYLEARANGRKVRPPAGRKIADL
ncbi:CopG family transcriptional regulator [Fontimonas sp. SYSU GA230001]|uniref:CopG family transcriptional regulator n=1 Tax=Fontimonas sp. SYSU GA230001 TaxID=3142450 RepID=UPI0032B5641E